MQLKKDLYLVSGGFFGKLGNVLAFAHADGVALVDAGSPDSYGTICENLAYWGYAPEQVTHVLCTHGHDDHAGTAAYFQKLGAKVVVGAADAYMLEQGNFGEASPFRNHQQPACTPDIIISEDTTLTIGGVTVDVYCVPGHTNGSVLYYAHLGEERVLFSGDMFNVDGEKGAAAHIWWRGDMDYSSVKLGGSFKKLWALQLEPSVVVGGHGNPRMGEGTPDMIMLAYKEYLLHYR